MPDEAKAAPEQKGNANESQTRTAESPEAKFDPQAFIDQAVKRLGDENKKWYSGITGRLSHFEQTLARQAQMGQEDAGYSGEAQAAHNAYQVDPNVQTLLRDNAIRNVSEALGISRSEVEEKYALLESDPAVQQRFAVASAATGQLDLTRTIRDMFVDERILPEWRQSQQAKREHQEKAQAQKEGLKRQGFVSGESAAEGVEVIGPEDLKGKTSKQIYELYKKAGYPVDEIDPPKY